MKGKNTTHLFFAPFSIPAVMLYGNSALALAFALLPRALSFFFFFPPKLALALAGGGEDEGSADDGLDADAGTDPEEETKPEADVPADSGDVGSAAAVEATTVPLSREWCAMTPMSRLCSPSSMR